MTAPHTSIDAWSTSRIRLRALTRAHVDFFATRAPDSELERHEDVLGFPKSPEERRKQLRSLARPRTDDSFFWVIEDHTGQVVGGINTFDCDVRAGTFRHALFVLAPFRRRGYAADAVHLVLAHFFRERRYQKAGALVHSFNEPSIRLHRRLGFTQEGCLRRAIFSDGRFHDELHFGLLVEEFERLASDREVPGRSEECSG